MSKLKVIAAFLVTFVLIPTAHADWSGPYYGEAPPGSFPGFKFENDVVAQMSVSGHSYISGVYASAIFDWTGTLTPVGTDGTEATLTGTGIFHDFHKYCCPGLLRGEYPAIITGHLLFDNVTKVYHLWYEGTTSFGGFVSGQSFYTPLSPIPEPETYAMFMAGLGLLGFIARRRKNSQA